MASNSVTNQRELCPSCGNRGPRVSARTLSALVRNQFGGKSGGSQSLHGVSRGDGSNKISGGDGWRFCASRDCEVVYFSECGNTEFTKSQIRVPVGVKEAGGERPLCYCFNHSVASIKSELQSKGRSDAIYDIRAKMKDPGCHCETLNPSGSCCLGSVTMGIEIARDELGMSTSNSTPANSTNSCTGRGEKIAKIGTLGSAMMASACCWLPLLLLAVGVSGAGIASTLETYRPVFIVVTIGFLGAAFYFTYRPRKAEGVVHGCCAPESAEVDACCPPDGKRRFNMMSMNKVMLWGVAALAIAFLFFPSYVAVLIGGSVDPPVTDTMNRVSIIVEGMTCEGCASIVSNAIHTVPCVLAVEVDYKNSTASVGTEINCPIPKVKILKALARAGYHGTFVESNTLRASYSDVTDSRSN